MNVTQNKSLCFRANSVTWNPHKMMGVPLQCSAILVREKVRKHPFFIYTNGLFFQVLLVKHADQTHHKTLSLVTGYSAGLQLYVRWIPLPTRQTVRRHLRHRRQGHTVWQTCGHLQILAHVEGQGGICALVFLTQGILVTIFILRE